MIAKSYGVLLVTLTNRSYAKEWKFKRRISTHVQAAELARELAQLPAALQSANPDLLVDYLATVFKEEDGDVLE